MKTITHNSTVTILFLISILTSFSLMAGEGFMLISEEEYLQQVGHEQEYSRPMAKSRSFFAPDKNAPNISVNMPVMTSELYSPIQIDVRFGASEDAKIEVESLEVLYGWLNLDITDRIKQHAKISNDGIVAKNIKLPTGKHNLTIKIMDTKERSTEMKVSFEVLEAE